MRSDVKFRTFEIPVDEPPTTLGGVDSAPNPVEYALAALAACQEITYRLHADALGIPLDNVAVTVEETSICAGSSAWIRRFVPGSPSIRGTVHIDSPAPVDELLRLRDHVNAHCPVLDLVSAPTPVTFELATTAGAEAP